MEKLYFIGKGYWKGCVITHERLDINECKITFFRTSGFQVLSFMYRKNFKIFLEEVYTIALDSYYIFTKTGNIKRGIEHYDDNSSLILTVCQFVMLQSFLYNVRFLKALNHWNKVRHWF